MRNSFLILFLFTYSIVAQETYHPRSSTNTTEFTIEKIIQTESNTRVYFKVFTDQTGFRFFFHRDIYIQDYFDAASEKYFVTEFVDNELHKFYTIEPNTTYNLQLVFPKIPQSLTKINILEPDTEGYNAWYWRGIFLNSKINETSYTTELTSLKNFFTYEAVDFLATLAHPTNTYHSGNFSIYPSYVEVEIRYEDGLFTKLRLTKYQGLFTGIKVLEDNDSVSPFTAIYLIKMAVDAMEEEESESEKKTKNRLQRELGKRYSELDGVDLALFMINVKWLSNFID